APPDRLGQLSDPPRSIGLVGDLLFFSIGPRRGLRRGTRATDWYEQGCALEARDPAAAMAAYRRAIAGLPELANAHNNLGRLHHDRGLRARDRARAGQRRRALQPRAAARARR